MLVVQGTQAHAAQRILHRAVPALAPAPPAVRQAANFDAGDRFLVAAGPSLWQVTVREIRGHVQETFILTTNLTTTTINHSIPGRSVKIRRYVDPSQCLLHRRQRTIWARSKLGRNRVASCKCGCVLGLCWSLLVPTKTRRMAAAASPPIVHCPGNLRGIRSLRRFQPALDCLYF